MKKRSRKNYPRGHWSNINNLREELAKHGGCFKRNDQEGQPKCRSYCL